MPAGVLISRHPSFHRRLAGLPFPGGPYFRYRFRQSHCLGSQVLHFQFQGRLRLPWRIRHETRMDAFAIIARGDCSPVDSASQTPSTLSNDSMTQDLQRLEQRLTQLLIEAEEIQRSIEALQAEKARMVASNPNILASAGIVKSTSPNG